MCIKKTVVRISAAKCADLDLDYLHNMDREFTFYYTSLTRIQRLLRTAYEKCPLPGSYEMECSRFMVWRNGERYWLDESGRVAKLYKHLGCNGRIDLEYVFANGIGGFIDEDEGIVFFYHTKELRHVPHVHVSYQGEEISIEILTLKVKGTFKNKKKQRKAVDYVSKHKASLLEDYNNKTNGIRVFCFDI